MGKEDKVMYEATFDKAVVVLTPQEYFELVKYKNQKREQELLDLFGLLWSVATMEQKQGLRHLIDTKLPGVKVELELIKKHSLKYLPENQRYTLEVTTEYEKENKPS